MNMISHVGLDKVTQDWKKQEAKAMMGLKTG